MKIAHILIVGSLEDPHVTRVTASLEQSPDVRVQVVDPSLPGRYSASTSPSGDVRLTIGDWSYDAGRGEALLCWWRDKTREPAIDSSEAQAFVWGWRERRSLLMQTLIAAGARFVNNPVTRQPADEKLLQLRAARDVGFLCPPTLATSDRDEALAFLAEHPKVIMKPLASSMVQGSVSLGLVPVSIPVCRLDAAELMAQAAEDFEAGPVLLQPELEKAYEVRTLAFGRDVRSFRIDSQASVRGQLDWRRASGENIFSAMETPRRIIDLCGAYLKRAGLSAGSFDFVVDAQDRWWFLECNREGQWAWLEDETHDLSAFFAGKLLAQVLGDRQRKAPTQEGHERYVPAADLVSHVAEQRRAVYFLSMKDCMPCAQINQQLGLLEDYAIEGFTVFGFTAHPADPQSREAMTALGVKTFPTALLVDGGSRKILNCLVTDERLRFFDPVTKTMSARLTEFASASAA